MFHERAFPYIGKTALGYFAYLGILVHHYVLTSNTTNQNTDLWRSLVRLALSVFLISPFLWQLQLVDWSQSLFLLYLNKTVVPCGGGAFILYSFAEPLFEHMNLLNRDYSSRKYCVFVHHEDLEDKKLTSYRALKGNAKLDYAVESLLPTSKKVGRIN